VIGDGGVHRGAQVDGEGLGGLEERVPVDQHGDGLGGVRRQEGQVATDARIVTRGDRGVIGGGVVHGGVEGGAARLGDREDVAGGAAVALVVGDVVDAQGGGGIVVGDGAQALVIGDG